MNISSLFSTHEVQAYETYQTITYVNKVATFYFTEDYPTYEQYITMYEPQYFENGTKITYAGLQSLNFSIIYDFVKTDEIVLMHQGNGPHIIATFTPEFYQPYLNYSILRNTYQDFIPITTIDSYFNVFEESDPNAALSTSTSYGKSVYIKLELNYTLGDNLIEYPLHYSMQATYRLLWEGGGLNELPDSLIEFIPIFMMFMSVIIIFIIRFKLIGAIFGFFVSILISFLAGYPIGFVIFQIVFLLLLISIYVKKYQRNEVSLNDE